MSRPQIPEFLVQKEKHRRAKNTCYSVFLPLVPEQSKIFFGDNAWSRAEQFMKGHPHTHKGFTNQADAQKWMAEQNALNETDAGVHYKSPKEEARAKYPERVVKAKNAGRVLYYTDCSWERGKTCGLGVWSPSHSIQRYIVQDEALVNHQRGELIALLAAFRNYELNYMADPDSRGLTVFSDSLYSVRTVNEYSRLFRRHRGANIWYTSKNEPVMHQDIIEDILRIRSAVFTKHRCCEVFYIPRDLNAFADAISRGKKVEKRPKIKKDGTEGFKWVILE
jgi:ribonuclease HI